jgi:hypothetical protein
LATVSRRIVKVTDGAFGLGTVYTETVKPAVSLMPARGVFSRTAIRLGI